MKKNYFKKVVSVFAATAVLAMATSTMSAFAADDALQIIIPETTVTLGTTTAEVTVEFGGDTDLKVNAIGLLMTYDENLKYVSSTSTVIGDGDIAVDEDVRLISLPYGSKKLYGTGTKFATITFQVPQKVGKYKVEWVANNDNKNFFNTDVDANKMVNNVEVNGFIEVVPVTTTPVTTTVTTTAATTTAATTVPTTTVTTTVPNTTTSVTAAPATTVITKATTTVTKVTKDTAKSSPATGTSSNGVAALAATMVVAAGAAVVLKKKKD